MNPPTTQADAVREWAAWLRTDPTLSEFNERLPSMASLPAEVKRDVWQLVCEFADECELEFDRAAKVFRRR